MVVEAGSEKISITVDVVERLIAKRRWVLRELRKFEKRYKMTSREFYEAWRKGLLSEPEDSEMHGNFMVWAGLAEELEELEKELLKTLKGNE